MKQEGTYIEDLIYHHLLGTTSQEEEITLEEWLKNKENHSTFFQILNSNDLSKRYQHYEMVDTNRAWEKFQQIHFPNNQKATILSYLKYAAILLIIVGMVAIWKIQSNNNNLQQETWSPQAEKLMSKSYLAGRQEAQITKDGNNQQATSLSSVAEYQKFLAENPANIMYDLKTQDGKEFWMTLEDGTLVHLNNSSVLKFPVSFPDDSRIVYLEGEAYFHVSKDNQRPFIVTTPSGIIKEYGTEFTVNTRTEIGKTEVVLFSGSIGVTPKEGKETMVKPGERALVSYENTVVKKVDLAPYKAWNEGEYIFHDVRMETLMEVLAHWYGLNVEFQSPNDRDVLFTGSLDRYGDITPILKAIETVTGLRINKNGKNIIYQCMCASAVKNPETGGMCA